MKIMKHSIAFILCLVMISLLLCGCQALNDAAELQEYDIGGDIVKTINAVVGERKVTGVETGTTNGVPQKQYTYESASVIDDVTAYVTYLRDNGWLLTQDFDPETMPGSTQLGKNSSNADKVIILSIAYEDTKYAVKLSKTEGTLDVN